MGQELMPVESGKSSHGANLLIGKDLKMYLRQHPLDKFNKRQI